MLHAPVVKQEAPDYSPSTPLADGCRQFILRAQNAEGGWPYHPGLETAVEPTCWALIALRNAGDHAEAVDRGLEALKDCQLPDGAWPARPGHRLGCWTTALASLALFLFEGDCEPLRKGLDWLSDAWPAEGGLWWQMRGWLRPTAALTRQNSSLRGWSWTPGAASWVEPTAYSLMLLSVVPESLHPARAARRRRLGEAMLYDRMCPGGGWNTGNPLVYGVPGERRVGPTVWALLALRANASRAENRRSLDWLEQAYPQISGPGSLALAHLCLEVHDRPTPGLEDCLGPLLGANGFLESVLAAAFSLMALNPQPDRLFASPGRRLSAS
jgi:hypothetical protein